MPPLFESMLAGSVLECDAKLHLVKQLASPLAYLHGLELVHRDIKPDNIGLTMRKEDIRSFNTQSVHVVRYLIFDTQSHPNQARPPPPHELDFQPNQLTAPSNPFDWAGTSILASPSTPGIPAPSRAPRPSIRPKPSARTSTA